MEKIIIQYDSREDVPFSELENEVKKALDAQWKRLQFGKMINQVYACVNMPLKLLLNYQTL
jgi:hypothetical protein